MYALISLLIASGTIDTGSTLLFPTWEACNKVRIELTHVANKGADKPRAHFTCIPAYYAPDQLDKTIKSVSRK